MSGNEWWSTEVREKLLSDSVVFSILSSDIPLDFHQLIWEVPLTFNAFFTWCKY